MTEAPPSGPRDAPDTLTAGRVPPAADLVAGAQARGEADAAPPQPSRAAVLLPLALLLAYPVLVHTATVLGLPALRWLALCCLAALPMAGALVHGRAWAWLTLTALAALLGGLTLAGGAQLALYLPPLVFGMAFVGVFAGSLLPGRTPLITGFARLSRGEPLTPELERYTYRLTWFWTLLSTALFGLTLTLTLLGPRALLWWSLLTNFAGTTFITAVFVLEFFLRRRWFAHLSHPSFLDYLRFMARVRPRGGRLSG